MITPDFEPTPPPVKGHPTIFMVSLGPKESMRYEVDPEFRKTCMDRWAPLARKGGKHTIEVHGRYCQLDTINLEDA